MEYRLWFIFIVGFIVTYLLTRVWIKFAKKEGLMDQDVNKYDKRKVAASGGIAVILGFIIAIFFYIGLSVFVFGRTINLVEIFALSTVILIITTHQFLAKKEKQQGHKKSDEDKAFKVSSANAFILK